MSILIKGMEMPKECWKCPLLGNLSCNYKKELIPLEGKRNDCPLVEVPPHGRLIDADALLKTDRNVYGINGGAIGVRHNFYDEEILNAPTIIESEGEA